MEIDYNNIYLNIERPPSRKYILIAIPMYLYRVETNEFSHGLNFFQKIVLKFKSKAGIRDEEIATYVGLDTKLISIVSNELRRNKLLNDFGAVTDKGKEKLFEVDGLIIDSTKKKIGYVLQYLNEDELYPYYVDKITPADTTTENNAHPQIITGTKGDGNDYTDIPFYLDELYKSRNNQPKPSERDVLNLIQNTNKKGNQINNESDSKIESLSNQLSIRFINEHPDMVWISTYVYLYQREDDTYEPDWRVTDPFGFGDNVGLKFYLNNPLNKNLLESLENRFADAKIIEGKILSDYQNELNKIVEDKISNYFIGFNQLDDNLQQYIRSIEKNYFVQTISNYSDLDSSVSFSLNLQTILENILKHDKEKRGEYYQRAYQEFGDDLKKRKGLINIWRQRLFSNNTQVPRQILNASKGNLKYGKSLLAYLVSFILTYNFDNKSVLFKIFNTRIDIIIEIAQLRNEKGHGQTSVEKSLKPLSKEAAEKYYHFIKSLINEYIQNQ